MSGFFWGVGGGGGGHIKYIIVLFGKLNSWYTGVMSRGSIAHQLASLVPMVKIPTYMAEGIFLLFS